MRVLIVEDDAVVGEVLQDFLSGLGHEPELVPSAEEALLRLQQRRPPELVLLDFRLPRMSGLDFLKLPLVRDSRIPIIVVSGIATEDEAGECLRRGAVDFVAKPIPFDHLQRLVEVLEPQVRVETVAPAGHPVERRQAPRARVALPVEIRPDSERGWATTSVDLSVEGMKVRAGPVPRPGPTARLSFVAPDDDDRLEIDSVLIRVDLDGYVFYFLNLTEAHFERLRRLVVRLAARQRAP